MDFASLQPGVLTRQVLEACLFPPGGLVLLAVFALFGARRWPRTMHGLLLVCLIGLWLTATEGIGRVIARSVEGSQKGVTPEQVAQMMRAPDAPGAVVVLGGGSRRDLREWDGPEVLKQGTLQRAVHGARVARWSGLPLLVSGGALQPGTRSEAELMTRLLRDDLRLAPRWVESRSLDTRENARESASLLSAAGIRRVFLVTDALHMPRAIRMFERYGLAVVPVPSAFSGAAADQVRARIWLPSPEGLRLTTTALHEVVGLWWFRWVGERLQ
ncbi:MAG TPA: YdcF family protein [Burkholderiaceae bacterium]|nr:YdcF family protein [Burkholderiaceae bacterium]